MSDSFAQTKRDLYELMQRMRHNRFSPVPPAGLTPTEARTMVAIDEISRHHEEVRPGHVAAFTHTAPSALSQTFKALEEKGFIERHRIGGDYRGVTVSLTAEGERLAAEGRRLHSKHMDEMMAYLGEEDVNHMVRILHKMIDFREHAAGVSGIPDFAVCPHSDTIPDASQADEREGGAPCA